MNDAIETIEKFLLLEKKREYDNKAVVGGLENALPIWLREAKKNFLPITFIQDCEKYITGYSKANPDIRARIVETLLEKISSQKQKDNIKAVPSQKKKVNPTKKNRKPNKLEGLSAPLTVIRGIGPKKAEILEKLNLHTLHDLLHYYPRRYDDFSQLKTINRLAYGEETTIIGSVENIFSRDAKRSKMKILEVTVTDGTGNLRLTWFNQPWISNQLRKGDNIVISGKVDMYLGHLVINNPDFEPMDREQLHTNRIVPVYPLTAGIKQKWLRRALFDTVTFWADRLDDHLPQWILQEEKLPSINEATKAIHFPENQEDLENARERLSFDEIFLLQYGVLQQKRDWQTAHARKFSIERDIYEEELSHLPYQLTEAQRKAIDDILYDLQSGKPMSRLLQGDVGSGKTVVSRFAFEPIIRNGAQAAVMAPTSILAEQHFSNFSTMLVGDEILGNDEIALLIGEIPENEKAEIREQLNSGQIKLVVGTHALFEDPIAFKDLQLAVIDEQHRFGVEQRAALRMKGENPHLLVMTATPIPRSLALTIYGDLDISVIDEMPEGRVPIETHLLFPSERKRAYQMIRAQVEKGHQAFIIYPQIGSGDDEDEEALAVLNAFEKLQKEVFPHLDLRYLHGRMKQSEKDAILADFRNGKFDVLVSTTVIEVGMDIPNATAVIIEGAERFGLAQLHQIRGRVGRDGNQSFCILIPSKENQVDNERLIIMEKTNDGFALADYDLKVRGPGEFLGKRQSGFSGIRLANLTNIKLIERARKQALALFDKDPDLTFPEHRALKLELERNWPTKSGDIS